MQTVDDSSQLKQTLDKRLYKLQSESSVVQTLVAQTNQREYENLSAVYVWWRMAATVDGYLDEAFQPTLTRRVKNHTNDGTNFRRLLYLMYGNNGLLKDDLERKNAVLCGLHEEYEKNHQLYAKDGVNKLAGYIKSQGGMQGVINRNTQPVNLAVASPAATAPQTQAQQNIQTSTSQQSVSSSVANVPVAKSAPATYAAYSPRIAVKITDGMRQSALVNEASTFFSKQPVAQQLTISPPIVTNEHGYGLALVKRNNAVYDLIGATDGTYAIRELLVSAYRKQYAALPQSMRCFFEIIKTQALPTNLQKYYDKLGELSAEKHEDNTRKKIQRRVMYVASENMLVLSPTYSRSGVVTLAKLKANPFEDGANDCFMPTRCRKLIEQRMIANNDFNLFAPSNNSVVPRFNVEGLASHLLRLDNKADKGDFVFVEFWNFEEEMGAANGQLFFVPSYKNSCPTKLQVTKVDMQTLAYDHINKWLDSYGDHISRPANQIIKFGFDQNGFVIGFDYVNNAFRNHTSSTFQTKHSQPISYSATFLAKDLCLALHSIGSLPLTTDIDIACSPDALVLSFSTDVADYTVAVPTTNGNKRSSNAFVTYTGLASPLVKTTFADESSIEDEQLFEAALAKSNAALSDSQIEKMLGVEVDDYDEILEGWLPQAYEGENDPDVEWTTPEQQ
jgi:hypothetical protein